VHLLSKIVIIFLIFKLIFTDFYFFNTEKYYLSLMLVTISICCLVVGIGMRRLFFKNYIEYVSLINLGYFLLCLNPLTLDSIYFCLYFLLFYIFIIMGYGGILLFIDFSSRYNTDLGKMLLDMKNKDYYTILFSSLMFTVIGMPPTQSEYPSNTKLPKLSSIYL
jgi:NADH:ubiquinone oxidoreductase subunit 2 (subunit N)